MKVLTPRDKQTQPIRPAPIVCVYCGFAWMGHEVAVDYGDGTGVCIYDYDSDEDELVEG